MIGTLVLILIASGVYADTLTFYNEKFYEGRTSRMLCVGGDCSLSSLVYVIKCESVTVDSQLDFDCHTVSSEENLKIVYANVKYKSNNTRVLEYAIRKSVSRPDVLVLNVNNHPSVTEQVSKLMSDASTVALKVVASTLYSAGVLTLLKWIMQVFLVII